MKDELGGKIMTKVMAHGPKTYAYFKDGRGSDKKAKGSKKCVIKKNLYLMITKTVY